VYTLCYVDLKQDYIVLPYDLRGLHFRPSEAREKPREQSQTRVVDDNVKQNSLQPPLFVVHGPTAIRLFDNIMVCTLHYTQ